MSGRLALKLQFVLGQSTGQNKGDGNHPFHHALCRLRLEKRPVEFGQEIAGAKCVDLDVVADQLQGHDLCQLDHGRLARSIPGHVAGRNLAEYRGDVDDPAALAFHHVPGNRP